MADDKKSDKKAAKPDAKPAAKPAGEKAGPRELSLRSSGRRDHFPDVASSTLHADRHQ